MSNQTFEIGLVGAGAISAGAYTAGVLDFLVYALDCWYAAKGTDPRIPTHDVRLSVFSGASAGAMTAALGAAFFGSDQPTIANEEGADSNNGKNKLFDCWVDRIDISRLLECRDLERNSDPVVSLLDSSILSEIADAGLDVIPRANRRVYIAEDFEVLLTVTNLRGVPYAFEVMGESRTQYDMSLHADYVHFQISESASKAWPDRYTMRWADFGTSSSVKQMLKSSALASGAFPIGLAPRILRHLVPGKGAPDYYGSRMWPLPTPYSNPHKCVTSAAIPVNWGSLKSGFEYEFQCVDGGVMNNEPLEMARRTLAGRGESNPRGGIDARKAVLLIDPFPSHPFFDFNYKPAPDLLKIAMSLFEALKNQARFKPAELMLASQEDVYSRFMIAPSRGGAVYPIACGALGGFGGFLKRQFRSHDFFLGRRNAQKFLRDHFVLPEDNPLFTGWVDDRVREEYCVRDASGDAIRDNGLRFLPIIPLVGNAKKECYLAKWPAYTQDDLEQLLERVERRVDAVVDRLVEQYFESSYWFVRGAAKWIVGRKTNDIVTFVRDKVSADLRRMQLMSQEDIGSEPAWPEQRD